MMQPSVEEIPSVPAPPPWLRGMALRRRMLIAFAFGCATALAYAPVGFFPIFWISFPALVLLIQRSQNMREAFALGWAFACGAFVCGIYWIAIAMSVDLAYFWWAVPFAVLGLPAFLALFYGAAMALVWKCKLTGWRAPLLVALGWFLAGYTRGHVLTGLPWNLEGYAWNDMLPVMQLASSFGIYGLTLLTLLAAVLPALSFMKNYGNAPRYLPLVGVVFFVVAATLGALRLSTPTFFVPDQNWRLVQPNIAQKNKSAESQKATNFNTLLELTKEPGDTQKGPVTHIVWPETASPYYLAADTLHRAQAAAVMPKGSLLFTGVIRGEWDGQDQVHYYNSLIAFDDDATLLAIYDKAHLVPFGEYMPLRSILTRIKTVAAMGEGFTAGAHVRTLEVPATPAFSPLICYEVIFPGAVADRAKRPEFLLNVTNDAWYGKSSGPYQHLAIARARAVEEGLPLVRVANTGISAMIDGYGRVLARLELGEKGALDSLLPQALPPTFFVRYGELMLWCLFTAVALLLLVESATRKIKK